MCKKGSFSQFLGLILASRIMPIMMMIIYGLAIIQIHLPFQLLVIMRDAGLPENHITLNCQ
jgi:hypothetical protein